MFEFPVKVEGGIYIYNIWPWPLFILPKKYIEIDIDFYTLPYYYPEKVAFKLLSKYIF